MFRILEDFKTYPKSVQRGIVLLVTSWVWFYAALQFIAGFEIPAKMFWVGGSIVLLAGSMKNWARLLCILCNIMAIIYCVFLAVAIHFGQSEGTAFVTTLSTSAILFAIPTYFLSIKSSSEFYKTYNHVDSGQER